MFKKIEGQERKHGRFVLYDGRGRLYVRIPTTVEENGGHFCSLGLINDANGRLKGYQIVEAIERDYLFGDYDATMQKYIPRLKERSNQRRAYRQELRKMKVVEGFERYLEAIKVEVKPTTYKYIDETLGAWIRRIGNKTLLDAETNCKLLQGMTTTDLSLRVLQRLAIITDYLREGMTDISNPYRPLVIALQKKKNREVHTYKPTVIPQLELDTIIDTLKTSNAYYGNLVEFMALTGCRPSEAIGLTYDNIFSSHIRLGRSIERIDGKWIFIEGSKNNKVRKFPMNEKLKTFVEGLEKVEDLDSLVFISPQGNPIDYNNFKRRYWSRVAPGYTPYNIRDTFITKQIEKGIPISIVALWCDTSPNVIQKHYLELTGSVLPV